MTVESFQVGGIKFSVDEGGYLFADEKEVLGLLDDCLEQGATFVDLVNWGRNAFDENGKGCYQDQTS